MGSVVLSGATSGATTLQPTDATTQTITLPANSGTVITTASSGKVIPTAALPAGTVLQVVQTVKTDSFTTTSAGPVDITGLSVSITPTSSSSKILVLASLNGSIVTNNMFFQLVRDSTNIYQGSSGSTNHSAWMYPVGQYVEQYVHLTYLDSPATASATTYKVTCGADTSGSTLGINRRSADTAFGYPCSITLMEIAA